MASLGQEKKDKEWRRIVKTLALIEALARRSVKRDGGERKFWVPSSIEFLSQRRANCQVILKYGSERAIQAATEMVLWVFKSVIRVLGFRVGCFSLFFQSVSVHSQKAGFGFRASGKVGP